MKTELKKYKLKDLLKIKNGQDHKGLHDGCYPVYGSGGIMRHVSTFLYDKPSVLLPRKGSLSNIQYCDSPFWTVDTLYYTEVNREMANPYYLYRYLSLLDLSGLDSGTGVPSMTFDSYYNISVVWLPDVNLQNRISSVLSNIDRKIVLNHQINDNLEKMAKQLYDYWFVQFDFPDENGRPYKSSGGAMVWNEKLKREIPQGWFIKSIGEIEKNIITGKTPSCAEDDNFGGNIPFVTIDDIRGNLFVFKSQRTLSSKGADSQEKKYLPVGSLSVSCIGTIGIMGFIAKLSQTNQQINSIVFENECNREFIYFALKLHFENAKAKTGNVFANMSKDEFASIKVVYPPKQILQAFHDKVSAIFDSIKNNIDEINVFTKQRDELLPLLMNGQASVNYHLSEWNIGFLCLDMHIEYDKGIVQKEADKQDFHPFVRQPYSFTFFKHTSYPFLVFLLQFKLFVTMSHKFPTDFNYKVHTNVIQRFQCLGMYLCTDFLFCLHFLNRGIEV